MSFTNLTTNDTFELKVGEPTYIGRHKFGIESKYISERQLKVVLEEDNRCFIKNLSNKKVKLNQALITISTEHQLQNGDEIDLLLDGYKQGAHLKFRFNLPELDEKLIRNVVVLEKHKEPDGGDHGNRSSSSSDYSSNENDHSNEDGQDDMTCLSDISQESSLLGDRDYF